MGLFSFIKDTADSIGESIHGKGAANAARRAADAQQQASLDAAARAQEIGGQITGTFDPFLQHGQSFIPMAQQAAQQSQALFGAGAPDAIMNNPMFQALLQRGQQDILGNQAALGRVGTGESQELLQQNALRTGFDVLNQERQANLANLASLQGGVGMGQQAAGSIGNALQNQLAMETGFTTDAAAAFGAGEIGAANARGQAGANLLGLGTGLLSGGFQNPFGGGFTNPFGGGGGVQMPTNFSQSGRPVGGF